MHHDNVHGTTAFISRITAYWSERQNVQFLATVYSMLYYRSYYIRMKINGAPWGKRITRKRNITEVNRTIHNQGLFWLAVEAIRVRERWHECEQVRDREQNRNHIFKSRAGVPCCTWLSLDWNNNQGWWAPTYHCINLPSYPISLYEN